MKLGTLLFRGLLRRQRLSLALIALCAMICFTGQLGLSWAGRSIAAARASFDAQCQTGDLVLYTENTEPGALEEMLLQIPGVQAVSEGMLAEPVRCTFSDGAVRSVRFFSFTSTDVVTPILAGQGELALSYGYKTGFDRDAPMTFTLPNGQQVLVNATAAMPMYTGVYIDRFIPSTDGDMVDIYAPAEQVATFTGESYVNYAAVRLEQDASADRVLESIMENKEIFVSYAAETEPAYDASMALETVVCRMCALFPWVMLLVGLVFVSIFLTGAAERSMESIRSLRTDGASLFPVFWGIFLFGLTGVVAGFILSLPAAGLLADFIAGVCLENMGIPGGELTVSLRYPLIGLAGSVALTLCASGIGLLAVSGSRVALLHKNHKARHLTCALITGVSTAAAVCMAVISMLFMDSLGGVRQEQFQDRYAYDAQIVYSDFVPVTRLEELQQSGLTQRCEPMLFGTAYLSSAYGGRDVTCAGLSEEPLLILRDTRGQTLQTPENAILLSAYTAGELHVQTGDLVEAQIRYGNTKINVLCTVAGISRQSTAFLEAVSIHTVEQYMNSSGVMNSVAVKVQPGCLEEFCRYARTLPGVEAVQTGQAGQRRFDQRYAGTRVLIWAVIAVSVLLGFSVCLLMCHIQWRQEIRTNTVLHLLGRSAASMMLRSGLKRLWGFVPGLAVGLAAAVNLMPAVLAYLSTDSVQYPLVIGVPTLLAGAGICLLFEAGCQLLYWLSCLRYWKKPGNKL